MTYLSKCWVRAKDVIYFCTMVQFLLSANRLQASWRWNDFLFLYAPTAQCNTSTPASFRPKAAAPLIRRLRRHPIPGAVDTLSGHTCPGTGASSPCWTPSPTILLEFVFCYTVYHDLGNSKGVLPILLCTNRQFRTPIDAPLHLSKAL